MVPMKNYISELSLDVHVGKKVLMIPSISHSVKQQCVFCFKSQCSKLMIILYLWPVILAKVRPDFYFKLVGKGVRFTSAMPMSCLIALFVRPKG